MFGVNSPTSPSPLSTQRSSTKWKTEEYVTAKQSTILQTDPQAVQLQTASAEQFGLQGLTTQLPLQRNTPQDFYNTKKKNTMENTLSLLISLFG